MSETNEAAVSAPSDVGPALAAADTRSRILAVALELFASKGYAGTSIRDIAEPMAMSKAALYYHFRSKEEILEGVTEPMRRDMEVLVGRARQVPTPSARELLTGLVEMMSRNAPLFQTLFSDPSSVHRKQHEAAREHLEVFLSVLAGSEDPTAVLLARCAVGAVQLAIIATMRSDARFQDPPHGEHALRLLAGEEHVLDAEARAIVIDAALRALNLRTCGCPSA